MLLIRLKMRSAGHKRSLRRDSVINTSERPGLRPIDLGRRERASAEIARRLVDYLVAGEIRPGERIPSERKLAEALGVGRSIVREALNGLTLLGLLDVRQGDGTYLRGTPSDLLPRSVEWGLVLGQRRPLDMIEARRHIEEILAGLAAQRRTLEQLAALRTSLDDMCAAAGEPDRFVAADLAFHRVIAQASGNETLEAVLAGISTLLQAWMTRVMQAAGSFGPSLDEHTAVLTAVETGDADGARAAMRRHMDGAFRRLELSLDGEPPADTSG